MQSAVGTFAGFAWAGRQVNPWLRPSMMPAQPCRTAGEALLASSSTDLESGAAGLLRLHYLLLPCEPGAGRPTALCAKRLASAEELLAPLMPAGEASTAELPPAVAATVSAQLAAVPLAEKLDPLALSSRCSEVAEVGAARQSVKGEICAAPGVLLAVGFAAMLLTVTADICSACP